MKARSIPCVLAVLTTLGCDATLDPVGALDEQPATLLLEAEDYTTREPRDGASNFEVVDEDHEPSADDPDAAHLDGATGGYLEALPDTFLANGDAMAGVNFFLRPGAGCTVTYRVELPRGGRYFVWLRAYGGGGKDNTAFIGMDGAWQPVPVQVCGPPGWTWTSALRDEAAGGTCSRDLRASIEVESAGSHNLQLALREDGFELDQLLLTTDPELSPEP